MNGLVFQDTAASATVASNRADIACFIGYVNRRRAPVPAGVAAWLAAQGWPALAPAPRANRLLDPARLSAPARSWLLAHGWPALPANLLGLLDASVDLAAIEVKKWIVDQGWPHLRPSLLANLLLDATPVSPTVRAWLLANGWADTRLDGSPGLDLVASGANWLAFTPLTDDAKGWLQANGWRPLDEPVRDDDPLAGLPVPVESFESFDRLFAWAARPAGADGFAPATWLGAAVRSFFTQGGARCLVVAVGEPWAYAEPAAGLPAPAQAAAAAARAARLEKLLPGFGGGPMPSPNDRASWRGIGVLHGLDEAALVAFPDLPEIVADAALPPAGLAPLPPAPEAFVECAPEIAAPADETRQRSSSPACTEDGYQTWFRAASRAAAFLREHRRDVELVLSVPLPAPGASPAGDLLQLLDPGTAGLSRESAGETAGIATAFLQLAYPWITTTGAADLPGGLAPPDGTLLGVAARSIATRGAYRSLGHQALNDVTGFFPALTSRELQLAAPPQGQLALIHRVSLLGPSPDGPRVLSDVTTSLDTAHRPAAVGRLTAALLRTSRHLGDHASFEPSGPSLWRTLEGQLGRLLGNFYSAGALLGASRDEAYSVRCDATTTTANDLDNGRVRVEVRFAPASPIGLITVILSLRESGLSAEGGAV